MVDHHLYYHHPPPPSHHHHHHHHPHPPPPPPHFHFCIFIFSIKICFGFFCSISYPQRLFVLACASFLRDQQATDTWGSLAAKVWRFVCRLPQELLHCGSLLFHHSQRCFVWISTRKIRRKRCHAFTANILLEMKDPTYSNSHWFNHMDTVSGHIRPAYSGNIYGMWKLSERVTSA